MHMKYMWMGVRVAVIFLLRFSSLFPGVQGTSLLWQFVLIRRLNVGDITLFSGYFPFLQSAVAAQVEEEKKSFRLLLPSLKM